MSVAERRLWLAGYDTRVLEVDGDGPPLVFAHGFTDSADTWRPLLERAERAGRRAVAVDLPGFGQAGPPRRPVTRAFAAVLRAAADRVAGPDVPAILVGHSMGGLVCLQAGIEDDAGRLAGIVPVATAGLHHPRWIAAAGSAPAEWLARTVPAPAVRAGALVAIRRLGVHHTSPEVRAGLPYLAAHAHGRRVANQLRILRALRDEVDLPLDVARISCPVLFVWGGHDLAAAFALNRRRIHALAARAPDARSVVIAGSGHTPQLEFPDELWTHIDGFAGHLMRPSHPDGGWASTVRRMGAAPLSDDSATTTAAATHTTQPGASQ